MIMLMSAHLVKIKEGNEPDMDFVAKFIDFFISFGDKTHHGKEEDILFREVGTKPISDQHREIMAQLLEEHIQARELIHQLEEIHKNGTKEDL